MNKFFNLWSEFIYNGTSFFCFPRTSHCGSWILKVAHNIMKIFTARRCFILKITALFAKGLHFGHMTFGCYDNSLQKLWKANCGYHFTIHARAQRTYLISKHAWNEHGMFFLFLYFMQEAKLQDHRITKCYHNLFQVQHYVQRIYLYLKKNPNEALEERLLGLFPEVRTKICPNWFHNCFS